MFARFTVENKWSINNTKNSKTKQQKSKHLKLHNFIYYKPTNNTFQRIKRQAERKILWLSLRGNWLVALADDPGSVPSAMVAHSCLQFQFRGIQPLLVYRNRHACVCTGIHASKPTHTHEINKQTNIYEKNKLMSYMFSKHSLWI